MQRRQQPVRGPGDFCGEEPHHVSMGGAGGPFSSSTSSLCALNTHHSLSPASVAEELVETDLKEELLSKRVELPEVFIENNCAWEDGTPEDSVVDKPVKVFPNRDGVVSESISPSSITLSSTSISSIIFSSPLFAFSSESTSSVMDDIP